MYLLYCYKSTNTAESQAGDINLPQNEVHGYTNLRVSQISTTNLGVLSPRQQGSGGRKFPLSLFISLPSDMSSDRISTEMAQMDRFSSTLVPLI